MDAFEDCSVAIGCRLSAKPSRSWVVVLLIVAAVLFVQIHLNAYVLSGFRWPGSHPRMLFYISTSWRLDNELFAHHVWAITNAANRWNTQAASNFKFIYAGTTDVTNVANDGINALILDPRPCPHIGTGCTAEAIGFYGPNNVLVGYDIVFYGARADGRPIDWTGSGVIGGQNMDTWSVALHEFGHTLGLAHSETSSIMGTGLGFGSIARDLAVDDVNGTQALYGRYTNEGIWTSRTNVLPGDSVTLYLDYPLGANRQYQIVADFDELRTGWELRNSWPTESRIFPLDRCPFPAGSREPTAQEAMVLPVNNGMLDSNGQAQVTAQVPESLSCFPTNRQWFFSVVIYGTNSPSNIEDVGVAVALNITTQPGPQLIARSVNRAFNLAELRWVAKAGYSHQIESSANLTDWTAFDPMLPALPAGDWLTSLVSVAQSPQFFRVRAIPPPDPPCDTGILVLVTSTNFLRVPMGGTTSFTVQLSRPPGPGGFGVEIARTGGDTSLQAIGDTTHIFHDSDWNVPVAFTISARADANAIPGLATFTLTGNHGLSSVTVTVVKYVGQ